MSIIDVFSRYSQGYLIAGRQPTEIADKLLNYFPHYGISEINIFGSGTEFKNSVYKELIMWYKIKIHLLVHSIFNQTVYVKGSTPH